MAKKGKNKKPRVKPPRDESETWDVKTDKILNKTVSRKMKRFSSKGRNK
jgi:hypothetical protein